MRYNDEVSGGTVAWVVVLVLGTAMLMFVAHELHRPGVALGIMGAYFAIRIAHARWKRR